MRHPSDRDGMEPRLHFRLSSGYDVIVVLPLGYDWEQELIAMARTQPFPVAAEITDWRGQQILNLRQEMPYQLKPPKGEG